VTNESILISEVIPATPERIFSAWMDSAEHSAFTGEEATVVPKVGGEHQSAGGYIKGRTLELHEGTRIVQSWRTTEFPPESPDSRVEITLEPTLGGTLVTLLHTDIPVGQGDRYRQGWNEYYLSRLKNYFADSEHWSGERSAVLKGADDADDDEDFEVDVDIASEVVELEPIVTAEAPTKVMSQNATQGKARRAAKASSAAAAKSRTPVKAAARGAKAAAKPALKAKSKSAPAKKPVKLVAKAKAASRSVTKKAAVAKVTRLSMKSAKMKSAAKSMKAAKTKGRSAAKAKRAAPAAKKATSKVTSKKGASSARSGRRR
jgi:uncharacterized protein YndB with AHSA1/START domain